MRAGVGADLGAIILPKWTRHGPCWKCLVIWWGRAGPNEAASAGSLWGDGWVFEHLRISWTWSFDIQKLRRNFLDEAKNRHMEMKVWLAKWTKTNWKHFIFTQISLKSSCNFWHSFVSEPLVTRVDCTAIRTYYSSEWTETQPNERSERRIWKIWNMNNFSSYKSRVTFFNFGIILY